VTIHAILCYLWAAFVASWGLIGVAKFPHKTNALAGLACLPVEYDTASTIFYFVVFVPSAFLIPMNYAMYVLFDVTYHKLLPPKGKRRMISAYFFRVIAVFVVMWVPYFFITFIAGSWMSHWVLWVLGSWAHLQGAVSAGVSLMKPDIWKAFKDFVASRSEREEDFHLSRRSSFITSFWRSSLALASPSEKRGSPRLEP
jgi:hypothetical protein